MRNKFEQKIDRQLKKSKVEYDYESEHIPYVLEGYYIPDFIIHTRSGIIYLETKGYLRPEHKRKMSAVKRQHPDKDIRIVFYSFNKKYIKWADKNGFPWSIGDIPQDWLKDS
jgi:predicted nuclease of restriction endonuclease-like RecB superfamily